MDPVSLAASIITLIGATSVVGSSLTRLWSLRGHPEYLAAAINEVTDFRAMLQLLHKTIEAPEQALEDDVKAEFERLLGRAKVLVDEFQMFMKGVYKTPDQESDRSLRSRGKVREVLGANQRKVDILRKEFASLKTSFNLALQLTSLRQYPMLQMSVQKISLVGAGPPTQASGSRSNPYQPVDAIEQFAASGGLSIQRPGELSPKPHPLDSVVRYHSSSTAHPNSSFLSIQTTTWQRTCVPRCPCQCHIPFQGGTPRWLRGLIGGLFFSFTGTPGLNRRSCNFVNCGSRHGRTGALHFQYLFPAWLLPLGVEITSSWRDLGGFGGSWSLKIPRLITDGYINHRLGVLLMHSPISELIQFMELHEIAPTDILADGDTMFEAALDREDVGIMLLEKGVNLHFQSVQDRGSLGQKFCFRALHQRQDYRYEILRESYDMDDYLDSLEFNSLHKIATGMEEGDISVQVKLDPTLINAMDYFGMTPLHAAVRAGDTNTVGFLLEAGADANARDCYGRTPLFYATGSYENCNRLLGFAADVTVTGICGRGALGFGLQYDAIGEDTISLLVRHGIDINHTQDLIGRTLLMQAASGAHVDICRALIECGAEIEALDCSGNPAVLYAILHNRFSNLKLLVKRGATLNRLNKFGRSIINWVARYGGVEIMKILTEVRIEGLPMSPEDIEDYWWLFDNGRHPRFEGVRAPIEHERAAFQAFLDSIIPGEPLRWTPDVERLNIPGSFPQDPEDDNSSLSDCGKGEEDNVDFHDTFEVLQEPQED